MAVAVSDFNGDGKRDLAVANRQGNTVSILLGNGDGTFQTARNYGAGGFPSAVAVGDFNVDGKPDLAVANLCCNSVSILLGHSDGTFGSAVSYATQGAPTSVGVGDFNRDGRLDLAAPLSGGGVMILIGNGDGTLQPPVNYGPAMSSSRTVAVGDVNGDGKLDLAVANSADDNVSILIGNGDGTFQTGVNFGGGGTGSVPFSVALGDFNGDGKLDVVLTNASSNANTVSILIGNGDGTFQAAVNYAVGTNPESVAVGDLNGDGTADLAVANNNFSGGGPGSVSALRGKGDGTFQPAGNFALGQNNAASIAIGDFNGDGRPDLAVANNGSNSVSVLLNTVGANLGCSAVSPGIQDDTFEAGPPWPAWTTQTSSNFGTPLCTPTLCGTGGGTAGPYSGTNWAWFGGTDSGEVATLAQSVVLPAVPDLRLRFQMRIGYVSPPFADVLYVTVDGNQVRAFPEPSSREAAYSLREVDLAPYADGRAHQVGFAYHQVGCCGPANFNVDDVQLVSCSVPVLSIDDLLVPQRISGSVNATFTVSLSFPMAKTVTVDYQITPGTATPGVDYDPSGQAGFLEFTPGTTSLPIALPVLAETDSSGPETFFVDLSNPSFAKIAKCRGTATIVGGTELSITKDDGRTAATPGDTVTYSIVASNLGPNARAANGASVTDAVPPSLTGASWTCVGAGGGTCTASGSGGINDTVNLPVGATVTYSLTGTVAANASRLSNTATVTVPPGMGDFDLTNNSATDTDTLVCAGETVVPADGRLIVSVIGAGATAWHGSTLKIGDSYSVEIKNLTGTGTPPGALTVFAGDDGCTANSTLTARDTTSIDPAGSASSQRVSFTATGTERFFRMRLANSGGAPVPYSVTVSDTALYSPAWSTNGSFDTFYSFQNTTGASLSGTLTLLDTAGAVLATFPLSIPVGRTASANTASLGATRNRTGTARFTHDGPAGAVVAEAAIANFSISPAYVQPVKFQAVREAR